MKINVLNSPRLLELKNKRRRVFLNKILFYIIALVVVFIGLAFLSRIPVLNISSVEIDGNKVIDVEIIKNTVEEKLDGNYFFVFPKKNILLYSKNSLKNSLKEQLPRIKDVEFSIKDKKILEVVITERTALYTWCGDAFLDVQVSDATPKCYFMDDSGFIFDEAPYFSGEVYFKLYGRVALIDNEPFGSNFSPDIFQKLITFKKVLEGMGLKPIALHRQDDGEMKMFLSGQTSLVGPHILFKADSDFKSIAENLQTILHTEPLQTDFKNKYSSLEYIDLRFGNRVYYKFK